MFNRKSTRSVFLLYLCLNFQHTKKYINSKHHINVCIIHKMSTRTNIFNIINIFRGSVKKNKKITKKLQRNNIVEIKTLLGAKKKKKKKTEHNNNKIII